MTTQRALFTTSTAAYADSDLFALSGITFDPPLQPFLLCVILASPLMLCALPLTWLLSR
jgi:hypothetical protein